MNPQVTHDMLQHITDPEVRQTYANILNGQIIARVHCNSKACNGRVIAHLMATQPGKDSVAQETDPVPPSEVMVKKLNKEGRPAPHYVSGLEGDRIRLDGSRGFRCYCGNSSILHKHEVGHIRANSPTKRDLEQIFGKMQANPIEYKEVSGVTEVDGFTIERIGV